MLFGSTVVPLLLFANIPIVAVVAGSLLVSIPKRTRRRIRANCRRLDGSWSSRRAKREFRRVGEFVGNVLFWPAILLILLNGMFLLADETVRPFQNAVDAILSFRLDTDEFSAQMTDKGILEKQNPEYTYAGGTREGALRKIQLMVWVFGCHEAPENRPAMGASKPASVHDVNCHLPDCA